jgi:hypothetical protein
MELLEGRRSCATDADGARDDAERKAFVPFERALHPYEASRSGNATMRAMFSRTAQSGR